jgi:predicted outer membrane repeat protein
MAQLRSAVANGSISTINVLPGTYLLTSSGSGELEINRTLTVQNAGGGLAVLDGNNSSRVFYINGAALTLRELTITRGRGAGEEGGGVYANSATLNVYQSTFHGNSTTGSKPGGAIYGNSSAVNLYNATVTGNTATGNQGGGIYANGGAVLISNSTIAGNTAATNSGGGIYRNAPLTLRNSIVADNTGGQISGSGTITSQGRNLIEGGCTGCSGSDLTADPLLGALADNGGNTHTKALLAASPAIGAAVNTQALATDQRGTTRPQGTTSDIGAFEVIVAPGSDVTPDGSQALSRLPSNGTNYTADFMLTNSGNAAGDFGLKAFGGAGAALSIVSVAGVAGDTTDINLAAGASLNVAVVYSVGSVPAGTVDTVFLRATAAANQDQDTGFTDLEVVRPNLALVKSVVPSGTALPGAELAYTLDLTNDGTEAATSAVHVESVAGDLEFKVGSESQTLPPGVTASVQYSSDGGGSWTYIPVSGGCAAMAGFDACVTRIRWSLLTDLSPVPPNNAVRFQFVARIP